MTHSGMVVTRNSELHIALRHVRWRLRLIRAWNALPASIACACLVIIIWTVVAHREMGSRPSEMQAAAVLLTSVLVMPGLAGMWPLSESHAAKVMEFRADLKDSLSAALYLEPQLDHPFRSLVTETAINNLRSRDLRGPLPFNRPRLLAVAVAFTCLAALVYHVNAPLIAVHTKSDVNEMVAKVHQIRSAAQLSTHAARNLHSPGALTEARKLRALADKMQHRELSPEMALVKQHALSLQLQRLIDDAEAAGGGTPRSVAADALANWQSSLPKGNRSTEMSASKGVTNSPSGTSHAAALAHSLALALQSKRESAVQSSLEKLVTSGAKLHNGQTALAVQSMLRAVSQALRQNGQQAAAAKVDLFAKSVKNRRQAGKSSNGSNLAGMQQAMQQASEALSGTTPLSSSTKQGIDALKQAEQLINHGYAQSKSPGQHPVGGTGFTLNGSHDRYVPLPQRPGHPHEVLKSRPTHAVPSPGKNVAPNSQSSLIKQMTSTKPNAQILGKVTTSEGQITQVFRALPGRVTGSTPIYSVRPGKMSEAESALRQNNIPPSVQAQVRNYFSSLQRK